MSKDTVVEIPIYTIQDNLKYFEDPYEVKVEKFLPERVKERVKERERERG